MEFRLIYHGKIKNDSSPAEKHAIRKQFHPQLSRLWKTHPSLLWMRKNFGLPTIKMARETDPDLDEGVPIPESHMLVNFDAFADLHRIGEFRFFPLVSDLFATTCSLDILYLRRTTAGPLMDQQTGDIDNRIKILFDALRMPRAGQEMTSIAPGEGEDPFFTLLHDDSLITEFRITSDRLLLPPTNPIHASNDLHLVITVRTQLTVNTPFGRMFE